MEFHKLNASTIERIKLAGLSCRCGPCQTIAPFYEQLSRKYPNAVFLKVDVDKCQETAVNQRVSVMPTFHFYRNKVKVDSMQGADPQKLEEKIQKYYDDGTAESDVGVVGHVPSKSFKVTQTVKPQREPFPKAEVKPKHELKPEPKREMKPGPKRESPKRESPKHESRKRDSKSSSASKKKMDLNSFIQKNQCEALNESDDHPLAHCLTAQGGFLESDCDEQLILSLTFNQAVKIHSIRIKAPADKGPKSIKLFINQPNTLDFDAASSNQSVQDIELKPENLEGIPVALRFVKFQNVQNIQIFVKNNQTGSETTQIDHLQLIGSPIVTTNMGDFKRVVGKKGEAH